MITQTIRNKVDALWDVFYSGGISNPLLVIEQITYLMFIHNLGQIDEDRERASKMLGMDSYDSIFNGHEEYRWSNIKSISDPTKLMKLIEEDLFPFIKTMNPNEKSAFARYMQNATFDIKSPQKLVSIIGALDKVYEEIEASEEASKDDSLGDVYEYMLDKLGSSDKLGQFRSPRQIIDMMVHFIKPTCKDMICDPACGTAGFLVAAAKYIKETQSDVLYQQDNFAHFNTSLFTGYDIDPTMLQIAAMNMMMHNIENPNISSRNGLTAPEEGQENEHDKYSVVLANPPFTGSIEKDTIAPELTAVASTTKTELLFIAQFLKLLKVGGRAAVIVPNGVLFSSSKAHVAIRKELIEKNRLQAVISMPSGVFKPYSGVSTAVLVFTKTGSGGTDKVWFYDMHNDGKSLDDKRAEISENDIPDIEARFDNLEAENDRARTEQSFMVPKDEIVANGYDLSINKYKEIVYEQEDLPSSDELIKEISELNDEYQKELAVLKSMLSGKGA